MTTRANKLGPVRRLCHDPKNSVCSTAALAELDWDNWFMDNGPLGGDSIYIHVRRFSHVEGETWHRVFPRRVKGRIVERLGIYYGNLVWLHDRK